MSNRNHIWLILLLLGAFTSAPAQNCDSPINDQAGVLNGSQVSAATANLVNQGADARVLTFASLKGYTLDQAVAFVERSCSSWQSSDGKRKSNLIVFALAPNEHKSAIFFGGAWDGALGHGHWTHIASDFMSPRFRSKDWSGGIAAGEEQASARIVAFKDEATHPAAPIDLSGLWMVLKWLLFFSVIGGLAYLLYRFFKDKEARVAGTVAAQQQAQEIKSSLANSLNIVRADLDEMVALKDARFEAFNSEYSIIAANFARLDMSSKLDPSQEGLSRDQYQNIAGFYGQIRSDVADLRRRMKYTPAKQTFHSTTETEHITSKPVRAAAASGAPTPSPARPTFTREPRPQKTVYEDNSVVIVNSSPYPVYEEPKPAPPVEAHSRPSNDTPSDSGSSFSWGSDSSSSSSSSDSGSSFSFDSGSSDSGGGGSSDF